jgi:hypothetical protein
METDETDYLKSSINEYDCYIQMINCNFEKWMKQKSIPNRPEKSVVVVYVPYHCVQV